MFRNLTLFAVVLALAACTPEQLKTVETVAGVDFSPEQELALLELPDQDTSFGRTVIHVDGTTSEVDCEAPAAPEAHRMLEWGPALQTFRAVACERGWDPARIAAWEPFMADVVMKESMGCFNLRRGPVMVGDGTCNYRRQGHGSDAGYGQLISLHYRHNGNYGSGWLCDQEGLCSADDIVASPHSSMTALVALVERSGSAGWCFNAWARRFHNCRLAPDR